MVELKDVLLWIVSGGGVAIVYWLMENVPALGELRPDLKRYVSWGLSAVVPVLARWSMTWQMARYPRARSGGLGVLFTTGLGWPQLGIASLVAAIVALVLLGWQGGVLIAATWLLATLVAKLAMARLGGLTGDVYGATGEVVEAGLLLVGIALYA